MEKVFDIHTHYTEILRPTTITEKIEIFKKEMEVTGAEKIGFMSAPHHADNGKTLTFEYMQNIRGLFLKYAFSPNGYALAGLEHPMAAVDSETRANSYLKQAEEYHGAGFDGFKMMEGAPMIRKAMGFPLCDKAYDKYYSFLEENRIPVTLHVANPAENWNPTKIDEYALKRGRYCDETYPTKEELHAEVEEIMKKHPKLRLFLAHFGFMSYDIEQAKRWLEYENTMFDLTPGGEQLIHMGKEWDTWHEFFVTYQDRIVYGTDLRAFPYTTQEEWETMVMRRPAFIRQFFETNTEHEYLGEKFRGVQLEKEIREKLYYKNAEREYGAPRKIDFAYMIKKAESLLNVPDKQAYADEDLKYIITTVKSL